MDAAVLLCIPVGCWEELESFFPPQRCLPPPLPLLLPLSRSSRGAADPVGTTGIFGSSDARWHQALPCPARYPRGTGSQFPVTFRYLNGQGIAWKPGSLFWSCAGAFAPPWVWEPLGRDGEHAGGSWLWVLRAPRVSLPSLG